MEVIYNNLVVIEMSTGGNYTARMPKEEYIKLTELLNSHDYVGIIYDDGSEHRFYKKYIATVSFHHESTLPAERGRVFV